jgi:mRNA interferase MazF
MVAGQATVPLRESGQEETWAPRRQDIIWIDCNPQVGQEMRDVHPFLVLSPRAFNAKTSLVIGLPMTTAEYNADNPFAVAVGFVARSGDRKTSYVLCHQPKSFDWRLRKAKPHPLGRLQDPLFQTVCQRLNQIIQLTA